MPIQSCLKPFLQAYEVGLAAGDSGNACWGIYFYLEYSFFCGKKLPTLDQDWGIYLKQKEDLSQARPYALTAHRYQVAHNLMGYSEDPFVLSGDIFEMNSFIPEENDIVTVVCAYQSRIHLAYIMCNDEQGVKLASELFGKVPEKN